MSRTKIRSNQLEITEILNHPDAAATTTRKGTVQFATQGQVDAGSPPDLAVTTDTLINHPGLNELQDMSVTSITASDTLTSPKELFNLNVNSGLVLAAEEIPDYGFDAASVTYASKTAAFNPPASATNMGSAFIRNDGMAVYIIDTTSDPGTIVEFLLGTAWDISTKVGTANATLVMSSGDHANDMRGVWFNDTGTKAIVSGATQWAEYSFATPYDVANGVFVQSVGALGAQTSATPLTFSQDGYHAYRSRRAFAVSNWYITEYTVGTPWDVSTISVVSDTVEVTSDTGANGPEGAIVNNDGTKLFIVHDNTAELAGSSKIREYVLSTPYLVSSLTLVESSVQTQSRYLRYMFWSPFGTDLYMLNNNATIYQYTSSAVSIGGLTTTLYHDTIARLATRSTGVTVNGVINFTGSNAQVVFPSFATASLPAIPYEGGTVYDTDAEALKVYGGSPAGWQDIGITDHTELSNIGTNTHAEIDTHISALNPHNGWMSVNNDADTTGVASNANGVSIGVNANGSTATGGSTIAIGSNVTCGTGAGLAKMIGTTISADLSRQIVIGDSISSTSVTTDTINSVKIGGWGGTGTNKNLLHLMGKGKLELYGTEAQFILPNYLIGSPALPALPSTTIEGGTVWDASTKEIKVYDGTDWSAVGGAGGTFTLDAQENIFAGTGAAAALTGTANDNFLAGNLAGAAISTADNNIAVGLSALTTNSTGGNNIAMGQSALTLCTGNSNMGIGYFAGAAITGAISNVFIGQQAGRHVGTTSSNNTFVGTNAGFGVATNANSANTFIGKDAGDSITTGQSNVALGNDAGKVTSGSFNISIGHTAAANVTTGSNNICIGPSAGPTTNTTNQLFIDTSETDTPLIHGDFATDEVKINGELQTVAISETPISYGTTGAVALDTSTGTYFYPTGTTTGAITFSFTNPHAGVGSPPVYRVTSFTLELLGAGDNAPVWPASVRWPGGTEPTWTTFAASPASGLDVVSFVTRDGGTTWLGMLGGLGFA